MAGNDKYNLWKLRQILGPAARCGALGFVIKPVAWVMHCSRCLDLSGVDIKLSR